MKARIEIVDGFTIEGELVSTWEVYSETLNKEVKVACVVSSHNGEEYIGYLLEE